MHSYAVDSTEKFMIAINTTNTQKTQVHKKLSFRGAISIIKDKHDIFHNSNKTIVKSQYDPYHQYGNAAVWDSTANATHAAYSSPYPHASATTLKLVK